MKTFIPKEDRIEIKELENKADRNKKCGFKSKEVTRFWNNK